MAVLTRFTVDLITDEELSERRIEIIAREMTENLHVLVVETEDAVVSGVDKYAYGHVHDTAEGDRCSYCVNESRDYKSGDAVVANS
jgi:hypothetical protein